MFNKKEFHKLENKSIIKIFGRDKFSFIQGIISNDVEILKKKSSIYSSILSPQGKFIVDFFKPGTLIITYHDMWDGKG